SCGTLRGEEKLYVRHARKSTDPSCCRHCWWQCSRGFAEGLRSGCARKYDCGSHRGAGGGQILQALIPALAGAAGGGLDAGSIIGQLVGGGASGAILTLIVGLVKNMMAGKATS